MVMGSLFGEAAQAYYPDEERPDDDPLKNRGDIPYATPNYGPPSPVAASVGQQFAQPAPPPEPVYGPPAPPPQYGDPFVDAPTGSLRAQLEAQRQGESQYGAVPQAIARDPVGIAETAALGLAPQLIGGGGLLGGLVDQAALGLVANRPISEGLQQVPGYNSLPEPLQQTAQFVPWVAAGPGSLLQKAAGAVIGGAGGYYGNQLDQSTGLTVPGLGMGPAGLAANLAGGLVATGIPSRVVQSEPAQNVIRGAMPEPALFPGLGAGIPPIHPNGGEMAFGPGSLGGGLPVPQPSGSLEDQLRASLEARGVSLPREPAFPSNYPSIPEGTMGSEFPDVVAASHGRIDPNSPAARMGAPLAYDPQFMTPPPADAAMRDLGLAPPPINHVQNYLDQVNSGAVPFSDAAFREATAKQIDINSARALEQNPPFSREAPAGGGLPAEATSSASPPPSSLTAEEIGNTMRQADINAGFSDLNAEPGKLPTPAEMAGVSNLEGDARVKAMEQAGNTPSAQTLSPEAQAFLDSPNGQATMAQRDAALNAGIQPGETNAAGNQGLAERGSGTGAGAASGGRGDIPNSAGSGGGGGNSGAGGSGEGQLKPQNPIQQTINVISVPTQIKLAGGHMFRQGEGAAITHPTNALDAIRAGFREFTAPGAPNRIRDEIAARGAQLPQGARLQDVRGPSTQRLAPGIGDKLLGAVPGFDRLRGFGTTYLNTLRDGMYVTTAERHLAMDPTAPPNVLKAIYTVESHVTGHPTLKGAVKETIGNTQGLGIGWNALAARVQHFGDVLLAPGNPLPWAPTARGEAVRALIGNVGTMVASTTAASYLGAQVNVPFLGDNRSLTNPYGIRTDFFKPVTMTPDKVFKTVYGTGGSGYDTILRFAGNAAIDLANGDKEGLTKHLLDAARSEVGVLPGLVVDLATGSTYNGRPYDLDKLKEEAKSGQLFLDRVAPIASESLWNAYHAWGPEGLLRAAPSLGAFEVKTSPTTKTDQGNAVSNDPNLPKELQGVPYQALGPDGKAAVDSVVKNQYPEAAQSAKDEAANNGNPVFQQHRDTTEKIAQQEDQRKTDIYNLLRDGKVGGDQVRLLREAINSSANAQREAARNDPEYKKAIEGLDKNEVSKALDAYYAATKAIPPQANGKPDFERMNAVRDAYVKAVESKDPQTGKLLRFELNTTAEKTNPLDRLYAAAQPVLQKYFADTKDTQTSLASVERSNMRRSNPGEDAILNLLGYEQKTLTPQAAQLLTQLRASLPTASAPVAAGRGNSAPVRSEAAAPPPAPPPQQMVQPLPTGKTLPPVVSNDTQQRQNFVQAMSAPANNYAQTTGIPPAVWAAMGASESNWGRAQSIFGIMGKGTAGGQNYDTFEIRPGGVRENTNSQFAAYNNLDDAFQHFVDLTSSGRYAPAWEHLQQTGDWQGFLHGINQAGYATAPNWADSIISLTNHIEKTYPQIYGR